MSFVIIDAVKGEITAGALRDARVPREEIDAFRDAVTSSHSYDEALRVIMGTVNVL